MYDRNTIFCVLLNKNDDYSNVTSLIIKDLNNLIIGIPYGLLTVFVLTSNLLLIYGFYKKSRPFTIITKLFIYLSLIDIVYILFTTLYTFLAFSDSLLSCWIIYLFSAIIQFTYFLGISTFATISFLRYWSIKRPLYSINAGQIFLILIVQVIVFGLLAGGITVLFFFGVNLKDMMKVNYILPISQFLAVCFVLSVNIMSYKKLKSMKIMVEFSDNIDNISIHRQNIMSEANICLLYITAFYILCPIPTFIVNLLDLDIYYRILGESIYSDLRISFIYQTEVSIR